MKYLGCILCAAFLQMATAQVLQYPSRNTVPAQVITNQPMPNQHNHIHNINSNTIRTPNNVLPRPGNFMSHMPNNVANVQPTNVITEPIIIPNHGNNVEITNIGVANPNMVELANMASINGNTATFNLGNGGFTITSGSPGNAGLGIQVLADALEVGGTVAVSGQIPIYGSVMLNGHLPTDGSASVNYACGGQQQQPTECINN
ncbi:uncharacterized protein LOC112055230 [Bicyclus anynana]|uniref:Uncharacterized protein LOC112055230 n=1 Tax=Bicyclus anynana TaxID=110368 RepID=A0ABM3LV58_BICAN|nr:uncharacterized protein LOC112055230 [Bicyclus anynana]